MSHLTYHFAAMACGKSTHLLQARFNHVSQGLGVVLLTAQVDDRFGTGRITSRLGISEAALTFNADTVFDKRLLQPDTACVLIDEAHFLSPSQCIDLHRLAHLSGVPVAAYGLRSDFRGQPFPGSAMLLTLADRMIELSTICQCGKPATMNIRLDADGQRITEGAQVHIGGESQYRSVCPACHYGKPMLPRAAH